MTYLPVSRIALILAAISLSACSTVRMPKIDILEKPEFEGEANRIGNKFPNTSEAPTAPTDIRSDKQWDTDARALMDIKDSFPEIEEVDPLTNDEVDARYDDLADKVHAYKLDDPAGGID